MFVFRPFILHGLKILIIQLWRRGVATLNIDNRTCEGYPVSQPAEFRFRVCVTFIYTIGITFHPQLSDARYILYLCSACIYL